MNDTSFIGSDNGHVLQFHGTDLVKIIKNVNSGPVLSLFTDLTSGLILSGGKNGVKLWDSNFKSFKNILQTQENMCISALAMNKKIGQVLVGTRENEVLMVPISLSSNSPNLDEYYFVRSTHKEPKQAVEINRAPENILASCGNDKSVKLWNKSGNLLTSIVFEEVITSLSESNQQFLFCGTVSGRVFMVILDKIEFKFSKNKINDRHFSRRDRTSEITGLDYDKKNHLLVVASKGLNCDVYKVSEFKQEFQMLKTFDFNHPSINSFTKINFGNSANGSTNFIRLCNLEYMFSETLSYTIQHNQFLFEKLVNNQSTLENAENLWKMNILSKTIHYNFQQAEINTLAIGNDGFSVVLGDDNGLLHLSENIYSFEDNKKVFGGHAAHVKHVTFFNKGEFLVSTGGEDMSIFIWKTE